MELAGREARGRGEPVGLEVALRRKGRVAPEVPYEYQEPVPDNHMDSGSLKDTDLTTLLVSSPPVEPLLGQLWAP